PFAEIPGNRPHAEYAGGGFRIAVVVGVGIDVVGVDFIRFIDNELNARNTDAVLGDELLVALDDGVVEPFDDLETGRGFDRRRLADRTKGVSDLADISRTQLETQRGIDAHRIQEFAAYELDAGNVGLGRTDVLLDQG